MDSIILGDPLIRFPHPDNGSILARLGEKAGKPTRGKRRKILFIDEYELHAHPDLVERFEEVCKGLPQSSLSAAYGYPILVTPSGLIAGYAGGMSIIALRLPEALLDNELRSDRQFDPQDLGWTCLDAWKPGAAELLPQLIIAAIEYVGGEALPTEPIVNDGWQAGWKSTSGSNPSPPTPLPSKETGEEGGRT